MAKKKGNIGLASPRPAAAGAQGARRDWNNWAARAPISRRGTGTILIVLLYEFV